MSPRLLGTTVVTPSGNALTNGKQSVAITSILARGIRDNAKSCHNFKTSSLDKCEYWNSY